MSMSKPRILIAGGGIGGLAAALALIRRGFDVQVYEQAPALKEVGAGVQVSANGMAVLEDLGVADRLMELAAHPEQRQIRMWNTGQRWTAFDLGSISVSTYGHPYVTVYRPDLLDALADGVRAAAPSALHLGRQIVGFDQDDAGVTLRFRDGGTAHGDALVGADGIHSVIRSGLYGADQAEFTGLVAWRGVIPMDSLPPHLAQNVSFNWVGPGRHVIQYPLRAGKLMNFVGIVERTDWLEESWNTPGTHDAMKADFEGWHQDVLDMIDAIPQPYLWALKLRPLLPTWTRGRITLLGDACHATLPFLAQGAVMAIEDGLVLARALEEQPDLTSAFLSYEAARQARTARIVTGSAENTRRFHNPALSDPATAQAYVEREWTPERLRERYDWIYRYDATTVPLGELSA
ncbi:FAD-dependent monooxygenase [Pseudoroseomonas sp. WGS1072]|uniref:FAD-dependent monooxygenase n=1 Tax=Roseomonas sp. WGS1072 TaxID=3366816 RepID=UPI003BF185EA